MWRNSWDSFKDLKKVISKNYGINVYDCKPTRKIMKVTTDQGVKALKIVNASYKRYLFTCEAMEHARKNGFDHIPKILRTSNGKMGVQTKKGIMTMSDWIDSREVNYDDKRDLQLTTEALAQLHKASQKFQPSKQAEPRKLWGMWIENLNVKCKEMRKFKKIAQNKKKKSDFDNKIIEFTDYFYDRGRQSIRHLEKSDYYRVSEQCKKKRTFCHHDLGSFNVLLTNSNDLYFIDFDNCMLDMTIHDLASLIIRNVRYRELNIDRAFFILKTYNKVYSVSDAEIKVMKALMEFPEEFWEFCVRYYRRAEKYPWTEDKFHNKLCRVINDIPVVETFIKKF